MFVKKIDFDLFDWFNRPRRENKMKRCVILAFFCIGMISIYAITASIIEPIRMLSHDEKADLFGGGCYDCPDCIDEDYDCGGTTSCPSSCNDPVKYDPVNDRCISGGPHSGNCGKVVEEYNCLAVGL